MSDEQRRQERQALQALGRPVHVNRLAVGRSVRMLEGSDVLEGFIAHKGLGLIRVMTNAGERVLLPDALVVQS